MSRTTKVSIIDYGIGNLFSVLKACEYVGMNPEITNNSKVIESSDAVILPGVGAFKDAMINLEKLDLVKPIIDFADSGKPMMGVCLGMQLLLTESEEFGSTKGLGIFQGVCKKFPIINPLNNEKVKVPQITWNNITVPDGINCFKENTPLNGINNNEHMYFVHSFYADSVKEEEVLSTTNYGGVEYCSSLNKNNIFAFQFHPEKSGQEGLKIYRNFKDIINKTNESRK
ncbi:glutamine amidotransferase [Tenacibaculum skagerrakense]|uniref:Imidazole glycerol phosphate synthase subunit HisH n=1 Tax=Tenacibaculum skagerrakense TaxID=186571 RepID=A0A4R2NNN5_9FLAO|nr:imidazole glycerol phosphate synthase subunit HisH [Tenacibaculum skagerrakense]TCP22918.1 glutamine amidotransferase [Tenacibaculum skagerrakense]